MAMKLKIIPEMTSSCGRETLCGLVILEKLITKLQTIYFCDKLVFSHTTDRVREAGFVILTNIWILSRKLVTRF